MDQVGLLAELYRYSSLAFVGGSFKSRVHNVLEPAAYSNAIIVGPYIQNSFEATEMNQLHLGLQSVTSSEEAQEAILKRISDVSFVKSEGKAAYQYLLDRRGAAVKYCDFL
jgi:3-deoxy-D-manno-octulosonic-acid transferase